MAFDGIFEQKMVSEILTLFYNEPLLIKKSVKEIVFGYRDDMLKWAKAVEPKRFPTDIVGVLAGVS